MTAPERIWMGSAYGKEVGVGWSVEKVFEQDVCYIRADETDRLIAEAVAAERERCAKKLEDADRILRQEVSEIPGQIEQKATIEVIRLFDLAAEFIRGRS